MLRREALWLGERLCRWPTDRGVVLNIGSSSLQFRQQVQPWIEQQVFAPARAHGLRVVHQDLFAAEGVDVAGDLLSDECQARLRRLDIFGVVCSNVLEHVLDRPAFAAAITRLLPKAGRALITVPNRFPYHPDPIDTNYRPQPRELSALFDGMQATQEVLLRCGGLFELVFANPQRLLRAKPSDSAAGHTERRLGDWLPYTVRSFRMACVELTCAG
jgi:SAM-dependent methyltransferase